MAPIGKFDRNNAWEDTRIQPEDDGVITKHSSSKQRFAGSPDGVATRMEVYGWYAYDFANSPYWQVFDTLGKVFLKRLAELSSFPRAGISAGSYPAVVLQINSAIQMVALLTFAAFGDFGPYRKRLLVIMTFTGSFLVFIHLFFFLPSSWWVAGVVRVIVGQTFILSNVYYNAYLSMLVESHYDVVNQDDDKRAQREVEVTDEMSTKGYLVGYVGGAMMQVIVYVLLRLVECETQTEDQRLLAAPEIDTTQKCSEFNQLFWLALSMSIVGLWWAGFALFTFKHLKKRAGPDFPTDTSIYCLGWRQAWESLCMVRTNRPLLLFIVAYFLWSDALATLQNAAILALDDVSSRDSSIIFSSILAVIAALFGLLIALKVQQHVNISNKAMLLFQLVVFTISSLAAALGVVFMMDGLGFYLVMGPVVIMMGSLQANSRSLFSSLAPVGFEASMFAFYAITDKGSSLLGYGIISGVHSSTGSYIGVFWYTMLAFLVSGLILLFIDVEQGLLNAGRTPQAVVAKASETNES